MNDIILEPARAYKEVYSKTFPENANKLFDELVEKSKVKVDENRAAAKAYRKKENEVATATKKLNGKKAIRVLLILAIIALMIIGIVYAPMIWVLLVNAALSIGIILYIVKKLTPIIQTLRDHKEDLEEQAKELYNKAEKLLKPLLDLFDSTMTTQLIEQTVPLLQIDKNYDMRRFDYLNGKYGLSEDWGSDVSTLKVMSGEIIGNPFIIEKILTHAMGMETYTGSITITWTEYDYVDGKRVARHCSQVLTASVTKPKPFFTEGTRLIYGNEAAPDLNFSRMPSHAERMDEDDIERHVRRGSRKIRRKAKKEIASGFTEMGNEEFDVLFGALDRDNEVEFRLLFTPLAQKNLLTLMKGGSPFGDDFAFTKDNCINIIESEHSQNWNFDSPSERYFTYDIDICRQLFVDLNSDDFRHIFFDLAPLLSIPLYQHHKPKEYIYKEKYERNYTVKEAEVLANAFDVSVFRDPFADTPQLLKTRLVSTVDGEDTVEVSSLSYNGIPRVDYIPMWGRDGNLHNVPVHWVEYIRAVNTGYMSIAESDISDREHRKQAKQSKHDIYLHNLRAKIV
ncbi:MAG: hypothetical protein IJF14_01355 [Clostridia bacterium]|nr:hypothetical protein [Clostridia bacterium]